MTITFIHLLIVALYFIAPIAAVLRANFVRGERKRAAAFQKLRLTAAGGLSAGILICVVYAFALHGRLIFTQVLLTGYLATSLIVLLQGFDQLLWKVSRWIFRLEHPQRLTGGYAVRALVGLFFRAAVICCIGLPYVLATAMTYRPRVAALQDPQSLYQWNFQSIIFPAMDGTKISGWWIPAIVGDATKTVLLCPGSNGDKASQLSLVRQLVPDGYNVLVIDFRAHGDSGGQLCSFGDLERLDVLGAMRWLRLNHPVACKKVGGIGVSTGAAALLAAAADTSPEGQNIDAIAVYDTFDRLDNIAASLSGEFVPAPLTWFVDHLALRLAGYQVGANLTAFAPAENIKAIWPRPVLVIHGMDDEFVPFDQGQALYDSALEPKMNFWISRCGHAGAIRNEAAAQLVRKCFDAAQRMI